MKILDCGHETKSESSAGYGHYDGKTFCYECCAKLDKEVMRKHGKISLYLTLPEKMVTYTLLGDRAYVTNWPSTLKFNVIRAVKGRHNIAGSRYDVWFQFDGAIWHGVQYGECTQLVHCKRTKTKV